MHFLQRFYKDINLLNIILFAVVIVLVAFALAPLFNRHVRFTLPAAKARAAQQEVSIAMNAPAPSLSDYAVIAENNLFHPERRTPKDEKPLPRPELVLYGTIVGNGTDIAYVEDKKSPKTSPGRGKRQIALKKGDVLNGFVLKEIKADRIVLTRGEETMVVYLTDAGKQRGTETTLSPSKATTAPPPIFFPEPDAPPAATPSKPAPATVAPAPSPSTAPATQTPPAGRRRGTGR